MAVYTTRLISKQKYKAQNIAAYCDCTAAIVLDINTVANVG